MWKTLARTIINGVSNNARLETFAENSDAIDGVQFLSTLDGRTCPHCGMYDNRVWKPDEYDFIRRPPLHPNCRCTLIPWFEGIEELDDAVGRPAANADFEDLAEKAYNSKAKEKNWSQAWSDLPSEIRKRYYY